MAERDNRGWVGRCQPDAARTELHQRQRARRSLQLFAGDDDMAAALCRADSVSGEVLRARIEAVARQLRSADGGRDGDDPRTWEHLRHDGLMILVGVHPGRVAAGARPTSDGGRGSVHGPVDRSSCSSRPGRGTDGPQPGGHCAIRP